MAPFTDLWSQNWALRAVGQVDSTAWTRRECVLGGEGIREQRTTILGLHQCLSVAHVSKRVKGMTQTVVF